jgi:hypothetical protein
MGNTLHPLIAYHPVAIVGSLVAGGPIGGAAKHDAEPLPEQPERPYRVAALARGLAAILRRPHPASA